MTLKGLGILAACTILICKVCTSSCTFKLQQKINIYGSIIISIQSLKEPVAYILTPERLNINTSGKHKTLTHFYVQLGFDAKYL